MAQRVMACFLLMTVLAAGLSGIARAADNPEASSLASYHYEPVPGKLIGIWVDDWASAQLSVFKQQYGFSGAFVTPYANDYAVARAAGFPPQAIMLDIIAYHYPTIIDTYDAGYYYIDEAVEHDCYGRPSAARIVSTAELAARRDYISQHRPGSKFVISGYKRCSHLKIAGSYTDAVMYSSYQNWRKGTIAFCHVNLGWGDAWEPAWYPGTSDQRPAWTDMKNIFGSRFSMTWVNGNGDEFDLLLGHATSLGLNAIWVYHSTAIDPARLEEFCTAAVKRGWLRKVDGPPVSVAYASVQGSLVGGRYPAVHWTTTWEIAIQRFQIERRGELAQSYIAVPRGSLAGHGTTMVTNSYSFTDSSAGPGGWWYRIAAVSSDGATFRSDSVFVRVATIKRDDQALERVVLGQNYPNPFNPTSTITFVLPEDGHATLTVYNVLGEEVAKLVDAVLAQGAHQVTFDASRLAGGMYFYRLRAGDYSMTRRMILAK